MTNYGNIGNGNLAEARVQAAKYGSANFGGKTITREEVFGNLPEGFAISLVSKNSKVGELVAVSTRDGIREGVVSSSEWASFFDGQAVAVILRDGSKFSTLVL